MDKIKEALGKLDVTNDQHWTSDGLPRIETVRFFSADPNIGRNEITQAAPGFTRANPVLGDVQPAQAGQGAQSDNGAEQGSAELQSANTLAANGGGNGEVQPEDETGFDVRRYIDQDAPLEAQLLAAQNLVAKIEQERVRLASYRDQAAKEVDRLVHAVHGGKKGEQHSGTAIRAYLASQSQELQKRAEAQQQIREAGVDLSSLQRLAGGAPIDRAMSRKTGYGAMRPVFNVSQGN